MKQILSEIMFALIKCYGEQKAKEIMNALIEIIKG